MISFATGRAISPPELTELARAAEEMRYDALAANDHIVFARPWLDGPTAPTAAAAVTRSVRLMTTVAPPVIRHPVVLAKALGSLDLLSGGRVIAALGPGSSARDYQAVGIPFEDRWPRFEEAVQAMCTLWRLDGAPFEGRHYSTAGIRLEPPPARPGGGGPREGAALRRGRPAADAGVAHRRAAGAAGAVQAGGGGRIGADRRLEDLRPGLWAQRCRDLLTIPA